MEKVEKQIAALNTKISVVYDIVSKSCTTPTAKDSEVVAEVLTNHQTQLSVDRGPTYRGAWWQNMG